MPSLLDSEAFLLKPDKTAPDCHFGAIWPFEAACGVCFRCPKSEKTLAEGGHAVAVLFDGRVPEGAKEAAKAYQSAYPSGNCLHDLSLDVAGYAGAVPLNAACHRQGCGWSGTVVNGQVA